MLVRYPKFDFAGVFPHWTPHREFAHFNNAASIAPCTLEPFMIKAFGKAKERLDPFRDARLIEEVDWFCAQEAQHYRAHAQFNKAIQRVYPDIVGMEMEMKADLDAYLNSRNMEFWLAYSEGFESTGAVFYKLWFEELDKYREGADPNAICLFDWHYAEEFEHKEVAWKLYMAVAARGSLFRRIFYGYFYRIYGTLFAMRHMMKYVNRARQYMLEQDRAAMSAEDRATSIAREKEFTSRMNRFMRLGILGIFSPRYSPARKPPPRGLDSILKQFEPGGRYGRETAMKSA